MRKLQKNSDIWYSEYYVDDDVKLSFNVKVLHSEKTPYQNLEILYNKTFGRFMTLDGYIQVTERDEYIYHDMICHVPMAVNPAIQNVLIIGGGDGGTAREVAKYPAVKKIDMVEIDEVVVRASQKYLPTMSSVINQDERLNIMFTDGLQFVKNAQDASYDLILVDSTDPEGPGEGLFTMEFYRDCLRILSDTGILINQHECAFFEGDAVYMKKAHEKISKTFPIAKVYGFNMPTYASGYWYFGFASKILDPVEDIRAKEWQALEIDTEYYNIDLHIGSFALPNYVNKILETI